MAACQFGFFNAARAEVGIGEIEAGAGTVSVAKGYRGFGLNTTARDRVTMGWQMGGGSATGDGCSASEGCTAGVGDDGGGAAA